MPPAKRAIPAEAAPQATITLRQIAAALAESHDLPKKVAEGMLGDFVTLATEHLTKGDKIRLTGLGILQVRSREARMGRNPATGESIQIAAGKKIGPVQVDMGNTSCQVPSAPEQIEKARSRGTIGKKRKSAKC